MRSWFALIFAIIASHTVYAEVIGMSDGTAAVQAKRVQGDPQIASYRRKMNRLRSETLSLIDCENLGQRQKRSVQIVYLRGFIWDNSNNPQAGLEILDTVKATGEKLGYPVRAIHAHWTSSEAVCNELAKDPDSEIILVGHSMGAAGAMLTSKCLARKNIKTGMLISLSAFDAGTGADVTKIPKNIESVFNISVSDPVMPGHRILRAEDPFATKLVHNSEMQMSGVPYVGTHANMSTNAAPLASLIALAQITGQISRLDVPANFDSSGRISDKIRECGR